MCFAPWVSLTTAIIEFGVAILLLAYYRKSFINRSMAAFIFLLGLYQLSEYLLCTFDNSFFWARFGFIVYSFLPALGMYFALRYARHHYSQYWVFLIPIAFSLYAIFYNDFILSAECSSLLVVVRTSLFPLSGHWIISLLYGWAYYCGFVLATAYMVYKKYLKDRNKVAKEEDEFIFISTGLTLFAPVVLVFTLPSLYIQFPSLYCQFALFFAICAVIVAEIDRKRQKRTLLRRKR